MSTIARSPDESEAAPTFLGAAQSLESILGDGSQRYLASGYRRVHRSFAGTFERAKNRVDISFTGTASAQYPKDWSVKGNDRALTPHLSSIDAIFILQAIAQAALQPPEFVERSLIVREPHGRISLRSGPHAVTHLREVPVAANLSHSPEHATTTLSAQIGTFAVTAELHFTEDREAFRVHPEMHHVRRDIRLGPASRGEHRVSSGPFTTWQGIIPARAGSTKIEKQI